MTAPPEAEELVEVLQVNPSPCAELVVVVVVVPPALVVVVVVLAVNFKCKCNEVNIVVEVEVVVVVVTPPVEFVVVVVVVVLVIVNNANFGAIIESELVPVVVPPRLANDGIKLIWNSLPGANDLILGWLVRVAISFNNCCCIMGDSNFLFDRNREICMMRLNKLTLVLAAAGIAFAA